MPIAGQLSNRNIEERIINLEFKINAYHQFTVDQNDGTYVFKDKIELGEYKC